MVKNILIAVKNTQISNKIKTVLTSQGYHIAAVVDDAYSALRALRSQDIALSILDYDLAGLNGLQLAQIIADENLGPVVLLSQRHIDTGNNPPASLFGILVKPITDYQLINTLNLGIIQYNKQKNLEKQLTDLKETLESRKIIEKAKGILMQKQNLTEDLAYKKLRKTSMEKRMSMKKVAEAIILMEEF